MAEITTGEWYGGKLFEWPEEIYKFKEYVNEIAQWLIAALEIASMALEIIKAYLICFLDPLLALVKAIIAEIRAFLRDFAQIGVYLTGDFPIYGNGYLGDFGPSPSTDLSTVWPLKNLIGGFSAAERRMIGRLANRADPGRPDVSPRVKVLAISFYVTADFTAIYGMIRAIRAFIKLFKIDAPSDGGLPQPSGLGLAYGSDASLGGASEFLTIFEAQADAGGAEPALLTATWGLNEPGSAVFGITLPLIGPPGWMIEVSTEPAGLPLYIERQSETDATPATSRSGARRQSTESVPIYVAKKELTQLVLYGGADQLAIDDAYGYNKQGTGDDGHLKDGGHRLFSKIGGSELPVPLDMLKDGDTYYFQRTFYLSSGAALLDGPPSSSFSQTMLKKDLPHKAKISKGAGGKIEFTDDGFAPTYYVRVRAVDSNVNDGGPPDGGGFDSEFRYRYIFDTRNVDAGGIVAPIFPTINGESLDGSCAGRPSSISELGIPGDNTADVLMSIRTALAILILARVDMNSIDELDPDRAPIDETFIMGTSASTATFLSMPMDARLTTAGRATGLEFARPLIEEMLGSDPTAFYDKTSTDAAFVDDISSRVQMMAKKIYGRMGNLGDALEEMLAEETEHLRTVKWDDLWPDAGSYAAGNRTILESVTSGIGTRGLVRNLQCEYQNDPEGLAALMLGTSPNGEIRTDTTSIDYFSVSQEMSIAGDVPLILSGEGLAKLKKHYEDACDTDALARLQSAIAANPQGVPVVSPEELAVMVPEGGPGTTQAAQPEMISYAQPNFPVIRGTGTGSKKSWVSCRTLLRQDGELFRQAGLVLNIAVAAQRKKSAWMYWRIGPMLDLEKFFQAIINWIESAAKAIQAIIDTILEYINYIQQRIYEVQALIRKINAIIQSIFLFEIPAGYVSFYYSDGTDGLLMDFMSSENKPTDAPTAWGACALAVVPLIPYSDWLLGLLFPSLFEEDTETTGGEAAT